jgi:hypothetical protein
MDLKEIVSEKINQVLDEKLDSIIEKNVQESIEKIFRDTFSSYGDSAKQLKANIESAINLGLANVKIDSYQHRVVKIVEDELGKYLDKKAGKILAERIKATCQILEKSDWKFSELLQKYVDRELHYTSNDEFCPTIIVERTDYGYTHIHISKDSDKESYNCEIQISINKNNEVYHYDIFDYKGRKERKETCSGEFENLLFAIYANKAKLVIDDYETEFYKDQD